MGRVEGRSVSRSRRLLHAVQSRTTSSLVGTTTGSFYHTLLSLNTCTSPTLKMTTALKYRAPRVFHWLQTIATSIVLQCILYILSLGRTLHEAFYLLADTSGFVWPFGFTDGTPMHSSDLPPSQPLRLLPPPKSALPQNGRVLSTFGRWNLSPSSPGSMNVVTHSSPRP